MIDVKTETLKVGSPPTVSVLIPTLNEENNLHQVLPYIPEMVDEVVIIDGHSKDNTVDVARALCPKARVIYQTGMGKGDALRCGIQAARGDIIVTLDADGSTDPREIPRFVEPLLDGYQFAKGSRFLEGGGTTDMPWYRKLGCKSFVWLVRLLFRRKYTDLPYGYNAFKREVFEGIPMYSDGFGIETEMHLRVLKAGWKVIEIPSFEYRRWSGEGSLKTFRDGWGILLTILRERFHA